MICPTCGAESNGTKFCENCGCSLLELQEQTAPIGPADAVVGQPTQPVVESTVPLAQPTEPIDEAGQPVSESTVPIEQPTTPVAQPYVAEVPGDAAWQAQPQQTYQAEQTLQMPPQQAADGHVPPTGGPQPPYQKTAPYQVAQAGNQAPNAAFILVIVGLVLSVLFVTFLPGLVCSIIGLVLNAGYNKKGLNNPRKTATKVIGIIGIVIAALCAVSAIAIGVITAQVVNELDRQGIDITTDSVEVTTDSSGHINVVVKDSSGSASYSGATTGSSSSAASSESGASSASSSADSSPSASASSASSAVDYDDNVFHDADYNPTLYALTELDGAQMQDLLEFYNFYWDDSYGGWVASDGSLYGANGTSGPLSKSQLAALPTGANGQPVSLVLTVEGYATPMKAFKALTGDIVVEDTFTDGDMVFAIVYGSPMARYLAIATETGSDEQTFLLFTEEAIAQGVFANVVGVNAGSSISEVWKVITGDSGVGA